MGIKACCRLRGCAALVAAAVLIGLASPAAGAQDALLEELETFEVINVDHFDQRRELQGAPHSTPRNDTVSFRFTAFGETHEVNLTRRSDLVHVNLTHIVVGEDDATGPDVRSAPSDCLFVGKTSAGLEAVFAFCGGVVHGHVETADGDAVHVKPLAHDASQHIAYRGRDLAASTAQSGGCALEPEEPAAITDVATDVQPKTSHDFGLRSLPMLARSTEKAERIIEVAVVCDKARYDAVGGTAAQLEASTVYVTGLAALLYEKLGGPVSVRLVLRTIVSFPHSDPWRAAGLGNGRVDMYDLMDKFRAWASAGGLAKMAPWAESPDLIHLVTGSNLAVVSNGRLIDGVVGLAQLGTWCGSDNVGITQATASASSKIVAVTIAHEIGHNLGLEHAVQAAPGEPSGCSDRKYVMSPSVSADVPWSTCSINSLAQLVIEKGKGRCSTKLEEPSPLTPSVLGNGIKEQTETCDCFLNDCKTFNPCCECRALQGGSMQCTLRAGAKCSANDPCCDVAKCAPRSANERHICRAAVDSTCDSAEVCDGTSAKCPGDKQAPRGTKCDKDRGLCYEGSCRSTALQCAAEIGGEPCSTSNSCGSVACTHSNGRCYFWTNYKVWDGTPCGTDRACLGGACVTVSALPAPPVPDATTPSVSPSVAETCAKANNRKKCSLTSPEAACSYLPLPNKPRAQCIPTELSTSWTCAEYAGKRNCERDLSRVGDGPCLWRSNACVTASTTPCRDFNTKSCSRLGVSRCTVAARPEDLRKRPQKLCVDIALATSWKCSAYRTSSGCAAAYGTCLWLNSKCVELDSLSCTETPSRKLCSARNARCKFNPGKRRCEAL